MSAFTSPSLLEYRELGNCNDYKPMAIQNDVFELDNNYYYIESIPSRNPQIDKITPLLQHDELVEDGIFVYVIVSFSSALSPFSSALSPYSPDTPTLFFKQTLSSQEIQTKHSDVLYDICNLQKESDTPTHTNKKAKIESSESNELKQIFKPNRIYYAGEFKYNKKEKKVQFNFFSGTFMADFIDALSPELEQKKNCTKIFKKSIGRGITFEFTDKPFINHENSPITKTKLNDFLYAGAIIYVAPKDKFENIQQIRKQIADSSKKIALIQQEHRKLAALIKYAKDDEEKIKRHTENSNNRIKEIENSGIDLSGKGPFQLVTSISGGKKPKSKSKSKTRKCPKITNKTSRKSKSKSKFKSKCKSKI